MGWTLITGASKGLGRAIAIRLADEGRPLLIHYCQHLSLAEDVAKECRQKGVEAKLVYGDFSSTDAVSHFISELGDIVHLVNNVGHFHIQPGSKTPLKIWQDLYQVNFFASLAIIQGCLPTISNHRGNIINIGSVGVGIQRADAKYTAYTSSKMSLCFLTKSLAKELAPKGVRVNMVSPGEMENSISLPKDLGQLPMGRPASLQETAEAVAFLMKSENGYITGQNIEIGGALAL